MHSTVEAGVPAVTLQEHRLEREYEGVRRCGGCLGGFRAIGECVRAFARRQRGFWRRSPDSNVRRLVLYEGWPVRTLTLRPPGGGYDANEQTAGRR